MCAQIYDADQMEPEHRLVVLDDVKTIHAGEPLDGVPFDCWWIGFLKLALAHDGVAVDYPYLVGLSGRAFWLHYETGRPERAWRLWTYAGRGDYDFLDRGCRAFGYARTVHRPADFAAALAAVCARVDEGRPALISCGHGPALFLGYHLPEGFYRWIHPLALYDKVDDHGWAIAETLEAHWAEAWLPFAEPSPFLYLTFDRVADPPPIEAAVDEALRTAVAQAEDMHTARFPNLRRGAAAWSNWIDDLEHGHAREAFLYERFLDCLATARECAVHLCRRAAEVRPADAERLRRAAETYALLTARLRGLREPARDLAADAPAVAAAIREARELDRQAVADLRAVVAPG